MIITINDVMSASKKIRVSLSEIEKQLKNNIENKVLSESLKHRINEIHCVLTSLSERISESLTAKELLNAGYFDGDVILHNWIMNIADLYREAEYYLETYQTKLDEESKDKLAVLKYESRLTWLINELEQIMLFKPRKELEIKPQKHQLNDSDSEQFKVACLLNELYRSSIRNPKIAPSKHVENLLRSEEMRKLVHESGLTIDLDNLLRVDANVKRLITLINTEKTGRAST